MHGICRVWRSLKCANDVGACAGQAIDVVFHQDNETLLKFLAADYSDKLRHTNRVQRVNIGSMSKQLQGPHVSAEHCRSELQIAKGLTKIIPTAEWPCTMTQFGIRR